MQPSMAIKGFKTKEVFEAYIEHFAAPKLRARQVFMDNLPAHKGERVRELVESASCKLLYLPPYSPDLSLSEEVACPCFLYQAL
jgi:transposase